MEREERVRWGGDGRGGERRGGERSRGEGRGRSSSPNVRHVLTPLVLDSGYNYDSTSIRRSFDGRSTAYQRSLSSQ